MIRPVLNKSLSLAFLTTIIGFLGSNLLLGQTVVDDSAAITTDTLCVGGSFATLGDIVISETASTDFTASQTSLDYRITLPSGFEFDVTTTGNVSINNPSDVTLGAQSFSGSRKCVKYDPLTAQHQFQSIPDGILILMEFLVNQ